MRWEAQVPLLKKGLHRVLVEKAYGQGTEVQQPPVYPPREQVFTAMRLTSLPAVRVVILGQDPYINEDPRLGPEAHGLCFSVREGIKPPPSLKNIFLEIDNSLYGGSRRTVSTDLTRWAHQGVLLLNASLTVVAKRSNSHAHLGWQQLTDNIIETIAQQKDQVVFMLWGAFAPKDR